MNFLLAGLILILTFGGEAGVRGADSAFARGADQLFWAPTLEQALEMAERTRRPIFLMGYSLVPNGTTYTKLDADFCSGVF